ncbi:hypothetical protein EYF80_053799 [Liparis tanakae]|uniref:Uncharacterized protein n=1 Tax=Liparis tanakae TaxID=230148 RepID=A0A4Z2F4K9_9TELE|nr:hypothetical protein EYF80_053799 [Liparis tanakae]
MFVTVKQSANVGERDRGVNESHAEQRHPNQTQARPRQYPIMHCNITFRQLEEHLNASQDAVGQVISSLPVGGRKLEAPDQDLMDQDLMDQDLMEVRSPEQNRPGQRIQIRSGSV